MSQTFVVEVTEKPELTPEAAVESLAKAFNISARKIELMLKRLPGVATKPISQQEASVVVTYFEQAGLKAVVKSLTPPPVVATVTTVPSAPVTPTSSPTVVPASSPAPDLKAASSDLTSSDIARVRLASVTTPEKGDATSSGVKPAPEKQRTAPDLTQTAVAVTPPVTELSTPSVKPVDVAELLRSAPTQGIGQTSVLPFTSKNDTRSEHDILRTTLIGDPDPRKTQDAEVYNTSATRLGLPKTAVPKTSLGNRLLFSALGPTLLMLLGSLLVTYFTVQPAFRENLQGSSRNPAVAVATALSSVLTETPGGEVDYAKLQSSINATRLAFAGQDLHFIVVTDDQGDLLPASWFASNAFLTDGDIRSSIEAQSKQAMTGQSLASSFVPLQSGSAGASQLEVVAQPLRFKEQTVGAVVVGVTAHTPQTNLWRVLAPVALLGLIPLALASLLALFAIRPLTRRVTYLTQRANDISRGNLAESVELDGNDELSQLGEALERLRLSMQSALDRLRRRR